MRYLLFHFWSLFVVVVVVVVSSDGFVFVMCNVYMKICMAIDMSSLKWKENFESSVQ